MSLDSPESLNASAPQGVSSTAPTPVSKPSRFADAEDDSRPQKKTRRRSTSHLKAVPQTLQEREAIKSACEQYAGGLDRRRSFTKGELEKYARDLMEQNNYPEKYLGFVMVLIGDYFWKQQFLATPFERRLLLLPHCLKHAEGCPADYDEFGLDCERCGACSIADYKVRAEQLGYKVLVAEGSPIVLKIIVSGYVDAILGVACLNVLEKAIDKVLIAGVPSFAVPLHSGDCKNTTLDESWVWEVLDQYEPLPEPPTKTYVPLLRAANNMFEENFERLLPPVRTAEQDRKSSPLAETERVAYDFLANGGKRFRPFITLAAFDAMREESKPEEELQVPDGVQRVAMAIEAFHKASLVHDDVQDDDQFRYGRETLHHRYGAPRAINFGDYLIGLGYKLVSAARKEIGAEAAADISECMAQAHLRLCDGQGAEMAWLNNPADGLKPLDALQIYALKTAPAFEAAIYAGIRCIREVGELEQPIAQFARQLGVGFQILNDLSDWRGDEHNKLLAGQDALSLRPTVLLAFTLQHLGATGMDEIQEIMQAEGSAEYKIGQLRRLYDEADAFGKAETLVERSRERCAEIIESLELEYEDLAQLFTFLMETVLADDEPPPIDPSLLVQLPIVSAQ
ncbi:polyprenyl synthetase family protein [Calycomorphotria hydatis]|uniref:Octaprenyl-diphosphate synthase n=1 Tax=Calycomorphotria hydatis TaxID=2528027 RepID=A0A517T6N7_9PLAN|nr:polyprenyl synthetase family protein [Calycomorphotria hydatis]QDT64030.1 Octaprenyl-diphosphate synthase [Calycomorphotria hydatis]